MSFLAFMGADVRCVIGTYSLGEWRVHPATCERPMGQPTERNMNHYIYSDLRENIVVLR